MANKNNQKLNSLFLIWLKCWAFFMAAVEDCSTVSLWIGVEPYPDYLMWIRVWCPVWGLNLQSYFRARVTEAVLGIWVSESSGCWEELSVPQCLGWVLWDCRVVHPQCPELGSALSIVPLWFSHGIQIMTCGCWAVGFQSCYLLKACSQTGAGRLDCVDALHLVWAHKPSFS